LGHLVDDYVCPFTHALASESQTTRSCRAKRFLVLPAGPYSLPAYRPNDSCFALFAPRYPLYFHANTNCPFCNFFLLITMQIAGGWGYPLEVTNLESRQLCADSSSSFLLSAVSCRPLVLSSSQELTRLSSLECAVPKKGGGGRGTPLSQLSTNENTRHAVPAARWPGTPSTNFLP
jgi:hypothetical protein